MATGYKQDCKQAVEKALGKPLTKEMQQNIQDRLNRHRRQLAKADPQGWQAKPKAQQIEEAAATAAKELLEEATLKKRRAVLQMNKMAALLDFARNGSGVEFMQAVHQGGIKAARQAFSAVNHRLVQHGDSRSGVTSIEKEAEALGRMAVGELQASPDYATLVSNREGAEAITRELFGEDSGNPSAKALAQTFQQLAETYRQRFNRAGGKVRFRDDWGLPHHHSAPKVATAGLQQWVDDVMRLVNKDAYIKEDGTPMTDGEIRSALHEAFSAIALDGESKIPVGSARMPSRSNRMSGAREIHFANADAFFAYQAKYGEMTVGNIMMSHLRAIGKEIALVEALGPNPDHTIKMVTQTLEREAMLMLPAEKAKIERYGERTRTYYDELASNRSPLGSVRLAAVFDAVRAWMVTTKLGGATISSLTDQATLSATAQVNNIKYTDVLRNELAGLNPVNRDEKNIAMSVGIGLNSFLNDINRMAHDYMEFEGNTLAEKVARGSRALADFTIRWQGLAAFTEMKKRAFGSAMMSSIGRLVRDQPDFDKLLPADKRILAWKGVTPDIWQVWRKAQLEDWGNGHDSMLTARAIMKINDPTLPIEAIEQAATKFQAHVLEEIDMAVIEPGARERVLMGAQMLRRGTYLGEIGRVMLVFKSFPITIMTRHWGRANALETKQGHGKGLYLAKLMVYGTLLGGLALQLKEILSGRDPRDMTEAEFAMKALLQGGGLGIMGDFLYSASKPQTFMETLLGPAVGTVAEGWKATVGDTIARANGEEVDQGAHLVRFGANNIPAINLWYTKAALNHLFIHEAQELASPGYLNRMRARALKEYDQQYWWEPGFELPNRPPDLSEAVKLGD